MGRMKTVNQNAGRVTGREALEPASEYALPSSGLDHKINSFALII
jgi:hypothetical protein